MNSRGDSGSPAPDDAPHGRPKRSRLRRLLIAMIRISIVGYLAWVVVLYFLQDRLLFPRWLAGTTAEQPAGVEVWTLTTPDGHTVEAWYWPAKPATGPAGSESSTSALTAADGLAPAVILCHGNAELVDNGLGYAEMYRNLGYAVLLPEYRGYGRSGGKPGETCITEDLVAFRDRLAGLPGIDPDRILYHGRSVGGGFACALAKERPPAGLVLESTFTSVASFTWGYGVPPVLCRNPLRSDRVVPELHCPILLLHGRQDSLIPPAHSERLAKLARHGRVALGDGGHGDFPHDWRWYEATIASFVRDVNPK